MNCKVRITLVVLLCATFLGCGLRRFPSAGPQQDDTDILTERIESQSDEIVQVQEKLRRALEKTPSRKIEVEPVLPSYNPLDDQRVSFSMVNEDIELVLYAVAKAVGMNLIIDPDSLDEERRVTLSFQDVAASTVLDEVLGSYDLYYEIDKNVIRVKPYQERIFKLNFLDTSIDTTFDVGGDVLGAGETETATGLSGSFKLSGRGAKQGNPYDLVEGMVKQLVSGGGRYSINRLSGSLYLKDRPAVVRSVARLVNYLHDMLSRQIVIEARIIEVTLSDDYSYGIDWSVVRDKSSSSRGFDSAAWESASGLVLERVDDYWTFDATIDALKTFGETRIVSNPTIRAKHGQPAMISVGTSFTYKKSVTTTTIDFDSDREEQTEVEVSTVFDGLVLGVIPFIEETGKVSLLINPIKSDVNRSSIEPEPVTSNAADSISLPEVGIKEISTTIGINSGDVVILGGLIDKRKQSEEKGFPVLSSIPILGYLFKNETVSDVTSELVIVLNVRLI